MRLGGLTPSTPGRTSRAVTAGRAVGALVFWMRPLGPTRSARDALRSDATVTVSRTRTETVFEPTTRARCGLVLYPGARIDPDAYAALAKAVAARGYRVVVPRCPMNIALFARNAADRYIDTEIPWAVGGHSLGGVVASRYAADHRAVAGVVLWAAYAVSDLSHRDDIVVASVSGTEDGLTTPENLAAHRGLLPAGTRFTEIVGGIHAFFGDYGNQPGDGHESVDRSSAQHQVVTATVDLLARLTAADDEEASPTDPPTTDL